MTSGLDQLSRRTFFQLAGAGAATLAGCSSRPAREILPYAAQPPELTPGVARHYATALIEDGFATGVLVASHEGRPTKIEGNPDHPASLGATRAIEQAAVLSLFDPQRARMITERGLPAAWSAIEAVLDAARASGGAGVAIVLEPTTSLPVIELIGRVRAALPEAQIAFWSPFSLRTSLAGNAAAFGRPVQTQLALGEADVVVTLDADLVAGHPMALAYARQLAARRRVVDAGSAMSRLYAIEGSETAMGVLADHRFAVRPSQIGRVAAELLGALGAELGHRVAAPPARSWVTTIARDLARAGRGVVAAGERQPAAVHTIACAINSLLGRSAVSYSEPVVFEAGTASHELATVRAAIEQGAITTLLVLGGNPAYTAPDQLAVARVPTSVYLGLYDNETARACRYAVPALHDLEHWDVARAYDGTLTPLQPLIEPLFGGRSVADVLHRLLGDPPALPRDRLRAVSQIGELDAALVRGVVAGSAAPATVELVWAAVAPAIAEATARAPVGLELELRPHPFVHDGRYSNNPWLLELPEPTTKLTWDHAAQLSPATAADLAVTTGDVIALTVDGHTIEAPVIVVAGHADGAIALHAGFGRDGGEQIARGIGANAFRLATQGFQHTVIARPTGRRRALAITQDMQHQLDRPIVRTAPLATLGDAEVRANFARERGAPPSLYAERPASGPQWAMSIDLTTCTGCTACVMACAAENNTPVVGKARVLEHREMHWLRIDRYVTGPAEAPVTVVQPMTCQHCERAPCEYVCPTGATTHSPDGLNEMTYNRCVGTRFCANNCPYKVRRFNWFDLKEHTGLRVLGKNPDVTIRDRGVMEKCTYCVQRIRRVEIDARIAERAIGADEVRTACQQACPTQAISFGSIADPASSVTEQRHRPHSYAVLHDQGAVPRTQYLARIRNPNGALP